MRALLRGRLFVFAAGGLTLLLLAVLAVAHFRGTHEAAADSATLREGPAFTLPTLQGQTFALADHANGPVFVYFWASWCDPCKAEAPVIQSLWEEYHARGVTFVGVNIWDSDKDARKFVSDFGLTFPVVRDEGGKVYLDYGVEQLPVALFMRSGLEVEQRHLGELKESDLRAMLAKIVQPA